MNLTHIQIIQKIMQEPWFLVLEFFGMIAFAVSGLILGYKYNTNFLGTFLLCLLPSFGGGIMRDIICGRSPIWFMTAKSYFFLIFLLALKGFFGLKLFFFLKEKHNKKNFSKTIKKVFNIIFVLTDALGLAIFSVIGVFVGVVMKSDPIWLWGPFFAFLTSSGGGILRDFLIKEIPTIAVTKEIYGEIAMFWGLILSIYLTHFSNQNHIECIVILVVCLAFLTRAFVYFKNVKNIFIKKI
jgi:polar amino acid transport system substrate-binding protein